MQLLCCEANRSSLFWSSFLSPCLESPPSNHDRDVSALSVRLSFRPKHKSLSRHQQQSPTNSSTTSCMCSPATSQQPSHTRSSSKSGPQICCFQTPAAYQHGKYGCLNRTHDQVQLTQPIGLVSVSLNRHACLCFAVDCVAVLFSADVLSDTSTVCSVQQRLMY